MVPKVASSRRTVTSGDVRLAVLERGDPTAPTVVLVHGFPDTSAVWDGTAELLAVDHHVVTYDVRGAGASSAPARRDGYRLQHLVADLEAVLAAVSPDRPAHLVGHDWGSMQLWEAVTEPRLASRVASFTSISGPPLDFVGRRLRHLARRPTPGNLRRLADQGLRSSYVFAAQLPLAPRLASVVGARVWPRYLRATEGREVPPPDSLRDDLRQGLELYRANVLPRLRSPRARTTSVPVQVVTLAGDRYVPPALLDGVEEVAPDLWRRAAQGGHWSVATRPDRTARWVRELVDHVEGAPAARGLRRARIGAGSDPLRHALVVITGAGSGFGRETALLLAARGATVVGADLDLPAAEATAALCRSAGGDGVAYRVDVGDTDDLEQFAKAVLAEHGVPDVVVNDAGFAIAGRARDMARDDWDRILAVNLGAVAHGCRLFGQAMVDRGEGGHIVIVASAAAFGPAPTLTAYATTKSAVLQLSRSLRSELACDGIGVSAVCPGFSRTGIGASARTVGRQGDEEARAQRLADLGLRLRDLPPRRVAAAIVEAVERDRAVVRVGAEAHLMSALDRFAPRLAGHLGDAMARLQRRFGCYAME